MLRGRIAHLVRRWVFAEANVTVDAENDILCGKFGNGFVDLDECLCGRVDK